MGSECPRQISSLRGNNIHSDSDQNSFNKHQCSKNFKWKTQEVRGALDPGLRFAEFVSPWQTREMNSMDLWNIPIQHVDTHPPRLSGPHRTH